MELSLYMVMECFDVCLLKCVLGLTVTMIGVCFTLMVIPGLTEDQLAKTQAVASI